MLIGGMFDIDVELAMREPSHKQFRLTCDTAEKYSHIEYTNNGRTATTLAFLNGLKLCPDDVVLVPEYTCISVINALEAAKVKFDFFKVGEGLVIDVVDLEQKIRPEVKAIYVIHYFGFPQPKETVLQIEAIAARYSLSIIEDLTQSLFSSIPGRIGFGDYIVSSTRKWFPMTDGGLMAVRYGRNFDKCVLEPGYDEAAYTQMFLDVARNYYGQMEYLCDSAYTNIEKLANSKRYLDFTPKGMTEISSNIFFNTNISQLKTKRINNYKVLYNRLKNISNVRIISVELDDSGEIVPFGMQIVVKDRDKLYSYLRYHKIIPEIQWTLPVQYYVPSKYALELSQKSLMLQCDQRYSTSEMEYTADIIEKFYLEEGKTNEE